MTLTDTAFIWTELSDSMFVDWFQFGVQYYNGDDNSSPTVVTGSSVAFAGSSSKIWRIDFDGEPYEPITGIFTQTITFDVPGAGTCVVSESLVAATLSPTPSPNCADIYISNIWIIGDDVRATVVNNNLSTGNLTTPDFVWTELSGSMRVDYFRFGASQYYNGDDYDSPTNVTGSSVALSGGSSAEWRTDFDGEPFEPITGTCSLTLTFDFSGWGTCVVSDSVSG